MFATDPHPFVPIRRDPERCTWCWHKPADHATRDVTVWSPAGPFLMPGATIREEAVR